MGESFTLSEFPSFCFAYVNILISRGDWLPDAGDIYPCIMYGQCSLILSSPRVRRLRTEDCLLLTVCTEEAALGLGTEQRGLISVPSRHPSLGLGRPTPTLALTTNTQNTRHNIKTCSRLSRTRYHSLSFGKPAKNKFYKSLIQNYTKLDHLIQCTYSWNLVLLKSNLVPISIRIPFNFWNLNYLLVQTFNFYQIVHISIKFWIHHSLQLFSARFVVDSNQWDVIILIWGLIIL